MGADGYLRDLEVTMEPVGRLQGYAGNAKAHTKRQVEQIKGSIREFGFNDPIGVWTNAEGKSEVVEGHGRLQAALELGMPEVPVVHLDGLTDAQRRAYTLAHNQLTMSTGWDLDRLAEEMDMLAGDYDMADLGFDFMDAEAEIDAFGNGLTTEGREGDEAYGEFVDKFKPKLTTDDCYTPQPVYDAVRDWACAEYGFAPSAIVRPFKPGGDYKAEEYPDGCVVLDNPPFSILSEIVGFYSERDIRFFLFAPCLTLFSAGRGGANYIAANADVVCENGAIVRTGFITSMGRWRVDTAPDLYDAIMRAQKRDTGEMRKITYPLRARYGGAARQAREARRQVAREAGGVRVRQEARRHGGRRHLRRRLPRLGARGRRARQGGEGRRARQGGDHARRREPGQRLRAQRQGARRRGVARAEGRAT